MLNGLSGLEFLFETGALLHPRLLLAEPPLGGNALHQLLRHPIKLRLQLSDFIVLAAGDSLCVVTGGEARGSPGQLMQAPHLPARCQRSDQRARRGQ